MSQMCEYDWVFNILVAMVREEYQVPVIDTRLCQTQTYKTDENTAHVSETFV